MRVPFEPPPGLGSNDTIYAAPGSWADTVNARFVEGKAQIIGGWQIIFSDTLTGVCRHVHPWTDNGGVSNIAFGTHSALEVYVGGVLYDITPAGLAAGSIDTSGGAPGYGTGPYGEGFYSIPPSSYLLRIWSLDTWGETLLGAPLGGTLYQWENDTTDEAVAISNAPDNIRAMLVTPERQVLALGCNEEISNDFNPLCIRGCNIGDLTDWTTLSSNNAFEHILEGGGAIVTGRMVGSYVAVWTDNSLHLGQFLGNPGQTYRFDRVDENCGIIGTNAACVLKGVAYWIGKDRQIRAWTPGGKPVILPCPIWKDFADNLHMAQSAKIIAVTNTRFDEVWFYYPDARDGHENSRYIAVNVAGQVPLWFRGDIARTAACDGGVLSYPLAVTADGEAFYHEIGTDADGDPLEWAAKSAAQYIDEANRVLQVQRMHPDFKDQENTITLTAYVRKRPQDTPVTKGPYSLAVAASKKDFRFSGAIVELEFTGTNYARFGKPTFDAVPLGQY